MLHKGEGHNNLNLASLHSFAPALPRLNTEMRYQERYCIIWISFESDTNGNGSIFNKIHKDDLGSSQTKKSRKYVI